MADLYLVFMLDEQRYGLPLSSVDRVVRRVEITKLIKAPAMIAGVINVEGQVIPVFNIRLRFGLSDRGVALSDRLIIGHTARRTVAMVVDRVLELAECSEGDLIQAERILPHMEYVEGVVKRNDGLILIHNLDTFLSLEEERFLQDALDEN